MTSRVISHFTGSPNTPIRIKSMLLTWMLSISFEKNKIREEEEQQ